MIIAIFALFAVLAFLIFGMGKNHVQKPATDVKRKEREAEQKILDQWKREKEIGDH